MFWVAEGFEATMHGNHANDSCKVCGKNSAILFAGAASVEEMVL
jgi:hypothetical protein